MAVAEARAAWQRAANRCFVQEDAKRAPKLACCPSLKQTEESPANDGLPTGTTPLLPLNPNPPPSSYYYYSNLPPDLRWWFQIQNTPNFKDTGESCEGIPPWWRTADGDELAVLVAQRSLDIVENCDLPHPPLMKQGYSHQPFFTSPVDRKDPTIHNAGDRTCGGRWTLIEGDCLQSCKETLPIRDEMKEKVMGEALAERGEREREKAELLEALRHSQTRAREAEKAAKEAQAEKEEVAKLFFKQASQLYAYRQWFQLIELNNLPIFPFVLPLPPPPRQRKVRRRQQKGGQQFDFCKYAVFFAFGLGLVGAGLLLGWTIGWMF